MATARTRKDSAWACSLRTPARPPRPSKATAISSESGPSFSASARACFSHRSASARRSAARASSPSWSKASHFFAARSRAAWPSAPARGSSRAVADAPGTIKIIDSITLRANPLIPAPPLVAVPRTSSSGHGPHRETLPYLSFPVGSPRARISPSRTMPVKLRPAQIDELVSLDVRRLDPGALLCVTISLDLTPVCCRAVELNWSRRSV